MNTSPSQQIIESGLAELAFGDALRAPVAEHEFQVDRDPHGRLWLVAEREGGVQSSLLHEPLGTTGSNKAVLSRSQWTLANQLAVEASSPSR